MSPSIDLVERAPVRVAYRRYTGPFGMPLNRFWRAQITPWLAEMGLLDCPRYGVALDNPRTTAPEQCRYDCCVELPPGLSLEDSPESTIAGGRFAATRFKGTGAEIGAAWDRFLEACAARDLAVDSSRPAFEFYPRGASFDPKTGVFSCELCCPVGS
jgi:AraC family transcriptional regulator